MLNKYNLSFIQHNFLFFFYPSCVDLSQKLQSEFSDQKLYLSYLLNTIKQVISYINYYNI